MTSLAILYEIFSTGWGRMVEGGSETVMEGRCFNFKFLLIHLVLKNKLGQKK